MQPTHHVCTEERTHRGHVDKVARYRWKLSNSPGRLQLIDKNELTLGAAYQRHAVAERVLKIAANWDWIACGAITVGFREGVHHVMDGQHRVLASRKRSDISDLPCLIFPTEDIAEEARGFLANNTMNKPVGTLDKHKAMLVAQDERALKLQALFDHLGIIPGKSQTVHHFAAVGWAYSKAAEDFEGLTLVLTLAAELSAANGLPIAEKLTAGLYWMHKAHDEGGLTDRRLVQRLRQLGAQTLLDGAARASAFYAAGGARVWAGGMLEALNKGLRRKFEMRLQ